MKKINAILLVFLLCAACANDAASADVDVKQDQGKANDKIVVGIMPFVREKEKTRALISMEEKPDDIEIWNTLAREGLVQTLVHSRRIATLKLGLVDKVIKELGADESQITDINTAVEVGRRLDARYMVLGKIVELGSRSESRKKGWFMTNDFFDLFTATFNMRLVDVDTGKIVMDMFGYGSAGDIRLESSGMGDWGEAPTWLKVVGNVLESRASAKAYANWASQLRKASVFDGGLELGNKLKEELGGEYLSVRAVKSKKHIEINADHYAGLTEDDLYLVYMDGNEKRDDNGVLLDREKIPLAVIKVDSVNRGYSVAELTPSGGVLEVIRKGDKVAPIFRDESRRLVSQKKIPSARPAGQSDAQDVPSSLSSGGIGGTESVTLAVTQMPVAPVLQPQRASVLPLQPKRPLENNSTDPTKVVATYSLPSGEANTRRIAHLGARKLKGKAAYDKYVELANSYGGDYLAAYQAGETARKLKKNDDAKTWYDKALAINPNYKPALDALGKLK